MIVREFYFKEMELRYFVGINQIILDTNQFLENNELTSEEKILNYLFKIIQEVQDNNREAIIQIISDKYVVRQDHIFVACYYMQKAFFHNTYISNKKNIEFLLYLSTNRQISKAIEAFGINLQDLKEGRVIVCIISPIDNINKINKKFLQILKANEIELTINKLSSEKLKRIIENYEILDSQINSVLKTYGLKKRSKDELDDNLEVLSLAVFDLICEKMALLNLDKIKLH